MNAWPLLADPTTPAMPISVVMRAETGRSLDGSGITSRGVVSPFRRDQKQDFANASGVEYVASQIVQVLGIVAASEQTSGELPWRTEFGSLLHLLRFQNMTPATVEKARAFVAGALRRWVPRARITSVQVSRSADGTYPVIRIRWRLISDGTEQVLVPGLETEIALG